MWEIYETQQQQQPKDGLAFQPEKSATELSTQGSEILRPSTAVVTREPAINMAGRRRWSDTVPDSDPEVQSPPARRARMAEQPDQSQNLNSVETERVLRSRRRRITPRPLMPSQSPATDFRALENRPMSTDIDLRCRFADISISEMRRTRRLQRYLDHHICWVCWRPHPVVYINLPCGHMTHCVVCNPHMRKCAKCQADLDYTIFCPEFNGRFYFIEWF
ncbi:hypothetical protein ElyMa_007073600 [Elysia marginata]|uniref:RING-type domain-containing protein n=1 Tax=Elysia marginata TaxID=1093978 RepID=A0AAV4JYD4_9GAST|nr:hypothetical protein ElyMa_007073600 [Elysia marginata]